MKRNGSYLRQYLPWLGLLLGVDALAALLLWLVDARAFAAMTAVIVLATVFLFAGVCAVLCARSKKRERAFTAFLTAPDAAHERALCRLLSANEAQSVHLLGETLRAQQQAIAQLQAQMDDYENYVELWAHEVKTPLALLTLVQQFLAAAAQDGGQQALEALVQELLREGTQGAQSSAAVLKAARTYVQELLEACQNDTLEASLQIGRDYQSNFISQDIASAALQILFEEEA